MPLSPKCRKKGGAKKSPRTQVSPPPTLWLATIKRSKFLYCAAFLLKLIPCSTCMHACCKTSFAALTSLAFHHTCIESIFLSFILHLYRPLKCLSRTQDYMWAQSRRHQIVKQRLGPVPRPLQLAMAKKVPPLVPLQLIMSRLTSNLLV